MLMAGKRQLVNISQCNYLSEVNISELLEQFWQINTYGALTKFNPSTRTKESFANISKYYSHKNKSEAGLLWKKDSIILPYNGELEKNGYIL